MSENNGNGFTSEAQPSVHVVLYHPTGARLSFHLPFQYGEAIGDISLWIIEGVNILIASGLSVEPPENLGDRMDVSHVVRGIKLEDDGSETDRIYFYAPWGKPDYGSQMTIYLNKLEDRTAFESASGLKVDNLPSWTAKAAPTRESQQFTQYARPVQFAILRKKARELKEGEKPADVPWALIRYVGQAAPAAESPSVLQQLKSAKLPIGNGEGEQAEKPAKPEGKNARWTRILEAGSKMPHYRKDKTDAQIIRKHVSEAYRLLAENGIFDDTTPTDTVIGYLSAYGMFRDKGKSQADAIVELRTYAPF